MVSDQTVRIEELPGWLRALFRPRENDRETSRLVIPGPIGPYPFPVQPLAPERAERYEKKLEKLGKYMAQRDRHRARPLQHLVASKYAVRSGLALMGLPVKAIKGMNAALAVKLNLKNITTVDDIAKASMKKLKAIRMPQGKLALIHAYAKDIIKHATMPQITEHPLPLEEILKPKFARVPSKDLADLGLVSMRGIGKLTAKKIKSAGVATKIGDLQGVSYDALVAAGVSRREAFLIKEYSAMLADYVGPALPTLGESPALGTLRVLMFDGLLELGQSITPESITPEDPTAFEQPEYPLDKPNIGREPGEIEAEPYVGYIVAADEIVIAEDLTTKGNDLVLVAKTIRVGKTGAITINTKPIDRDAATEEIDGLDADNGGDLVFLCQQYSIFPDCVFHTSGAAGQDGGAGKPMNKPDSLEEGVHFDKPQRSGSVSGTFWGALRDNEQCKFKIRQSDDPMQALIGHIVDDEGSMGLPITYEGWHDKRWGPAVDIAGEWTLWNSIKDAAPRYYLIFVDIPDPSYPTAGRPGGYGGNPGKISLIMPDLSGATRIDGLHVEAMTGADGAPGWGGKGGDCTPDQIRRGGLPVTTPDYLDEYTIKKAQHTYRGDPGEPFVGGWDRFKRLKGERLDSSAIVDKLEDSICAVIFGADLLVLYARKLAHKRSGVWTEKFVWGFPWPLGIRISVVLRNALHCSRTVSNSIPPRIPDSMRLYIDHAPSGEPKSALPTETESLAKLSKSWHRAVYEILPEYPLKQYAQADKAYRRGDFDLAAEFYGVVLSFAQEVPDFQADQATVVSDAGYRLDRISEGYDYFGFTADTIIPTSPTRDYFPLPLTTAYSDTVEFYEAAIRGTHDSIETIEMGKETIRQFWAKHKLTVEDIQESIAMLDMEMAILESETDAMEQEINAMHWANQRLSGLLQRWAQGVNDKIKELQKKKEEEGPGWWDVVITVWNVVKLVASIVAMCFGYVAAVAASIDALQKLGEIKDHINDLRIACGELVSNLDDWSWEQISEYLDVMGGVTKEIEAWYDEVEKAWKEADKKLQEVKSTFEETRTKFDQLTAVDMSEEEATEFQDNVLLADEIGVSGAMDYLQIQEQIYLNNDMLGARYSSLQALTEKRVKLVYQALSLVRQLAAHKAEAKYLDELLEELTWNTEQKQAALQHLTNMGQHSLDALMHRLDRQNRQVKYLNLDKQLSPGYYAYFIDEQAHVGTVLQAKNRLLADMMDWIEENNNIGRLKVVVTDDPDYVGNPGGITIVAPPALTKFTKGRYLRPSGILEIEPLRQTVLVERLAEGIGNRRSDPGELARLLVSQFLIENGDAFDLISPEALGFDVPPEVVESILSRERTHHPLLNTSVAGELDDITVVLAYALARGGVTLPQLTSLLQQTAVAIPPSLKSRIEHLKNAWVALYNDINGEQVTSLRSVVEAVRQAAGNPAHIRTVLDEALIAGGQFVWLGCFHLDQQDIQDEITNSYDPDPSVQEAVLARAYGGEPWHVVAAVVLLYAGLDATELGSLVGEYATDPNPLGDCIANILKPQWEALRTSVLETRHDIEIHITLDDYMGIPTAAETFRKMRYLAARAKIPTDINLLLEKLPSNLYPLKTVTDTTEVIEFTFENADDVVTQAPLATPLGLNIADVHFSDLFGRSILGKWALSFTYKGNRPALPDLDLVEMEFLHTYVEHD